MSLRDIQHPGPNHGGMLDRTAGANLFRHTLSRIPTLFGRLMYLASLRDPNTGTYRHYGLSSAFGREQSTQALVTSHTRAFREWLRLPLEEKHADMVLYLESLDDPKGLVVKYWQESHGYGGGVPDAASKADRQLYMDDVERLLTVIKGSNGGGSSAPKSSRQK